MKLRNEARHLKRKSISSMRSAMGAFNSPHDDGRTTAVLLHLQHAFEMQLKAALVQQRTPGLFDRETGRSIGFARCLHEARSAANLKLTDEEAGTLRAVDAMRDDEQHWYTLVDEGLLYLHTRAAVTLFDDLLHRSFAERLADHLPLRVLPVGSEPPQDFQTLVDREYRHISTLLRPHRRARAEAEARLRALLAMEAHIEEDTRVSVTDVRRVLSGVRDGKTRDQVFPRLSLVGASVSGEGLTVEVRFVKNGGLGVRLVGADEAVDAAAVRVVDLQRKYHRSATELASTLGLTPPKAGALRAHLGINTDEGCRHVFDFGAQKPVRYSDNAFTRMRDALREGVDMGAVWAAHGSNRRTRGRVPCSQPGCAAPRLAS